MATVDNFNRANTTTGLAGSTPSDGGSAWLAALSGSLGILSNQGYASSGGPDSRVVISRGSVGAVAVGVTFAVVGTDCGLILRATDVNNFLVVVVTTGGLDFYRVTAGAFTNIGSYAGAISNNDVISAEVDAFNVWTIKQNTTARISGVSEAQNASSTTHGLRSNGDTTVRFDDFTVTQAGGATRRRARAMLMSMN